MIDLEDEEQYNEERSLGSSTSQASITGHSTMVSDAHATICEIGDDESEGAGRNVEV